MHALLAATRGGDITLVTTAGNFHGRFLEVTGDGLVKLQLGNYHSNAGKTAVFTIDHIVGVIPA